MNRTLVRFTLFAVIMVNCESLARSEQVSSAPVKHFGQASRDETMEKKGERDYEGDEGEDYVGYDDNDNEDGNDDNDDEDDDDNDTDKDNHGGNETTVGENGDVDLHEGSDGEYVGYDDNDNEDGNDDNDDEDDDDNDTDKDNHGGNETTVGENGDVGLHEGSDGEFDDDEDSLVREIGTCLAKCSALVERLQSTRQSFET
eukprot:TRINITY_DN16692_c0_g1_i1.p1 TRINITY_DN16692_c0_g1~~TRINITY_DN16692_c0_g1_i1.p1  ORF type:complete len:201 (-),score=67.41 TRINITY_DN16692_c0_g1_i1:45-647(-)